MEPVIKEVSSVVISRRISVATKDGGHKHQLGVKRAAEILNQHGGANIPVTVDDTPEAQQHLKALADMTGTRVERVDSGFLLAQATAEDERQREIDGDPVIELESVEARAPEAAEEAPEADDTAEIEEESTEPPEAMSRRGLIVIGPNDVFTSADDALSRLREWEGQDHPAISPRYHQGLTKTFHNGSPHGQIISVYKDVRKYGMMQVYGKARAFKDLVLKSEAPEFKHYQKLLKHKWLPHDARTHSAPGRIDMAYFKLWAMFALLKDETERQRIEKNKAA